MAVAYDSSKIASYSNDISEACMSLKYHQCIKVLFLKSLIQALRSNLPWAHIIANLLSNVFFIAFLLVVNVSSVPSAFFAPKHAFNPLADYIPWSSLFMFFFTQVEILVSVVNIWVVNCVNIPWNKHEYIFLHHCPTHIVNNTTYFACWFNIKIKRNFDGVWYNYRISLTMWYINVNVLVWIWYVWYDLSDVLLFTFKGKLSSLFYHRI